MKKETNKQAKTTHKKMKQRGASLKKKKSTRLNPSSNLSKDGGKRSKLIKLEVKSETLPHITVKFKKSMTF